MEGNNDTTRTSGTWGMIVDTLYPALIRILTGLLIIVLCAWMLVGGKARRFIPILYRLSSPQRRNGISKLANPDRKSVV